MRALKVATLSVLTVATLALSSCAGASGTDNSSESTELSGDITFWTYPLGASGESSYWEPVVERFNEIYPDIDVNVIIQPFANRDEKILTALAGNAAPDVMYINPDYIPKYAEQKALVPLTDILADDMDDFRESALAAELYDGEYYAVPWLMSSSPTICFPKVLEAAGVECPSTWDDVREIAPKLEAAGYFTMQYDGAIEVGLNNSFYPYLLQAGGAILNDDFTKAAFNSEAGVEALDFLATLAKEGHVPPQVLTTNATFEQTPAGQGKVGFIAGASLPMVTGLLGEDELQISAPLSNVTQSSVGTVGGLAMFSQGDNQGAAKAWVEFLTDPDEMELFLKDTGYFSPRESITGLFEGDPTFGEAEKYLDTVHAGVMHPDAREIMDLLSPHLQSALLGRTSAQDALDQAADEVNQMLDR